MTEFTSSSGSLHHRKCGAPPIGHEVRSISNDSCSEEGSGPLHAENSLLPVLSEEAAAQIELYGGYPLIQSMLRFEEVRNCAFKREGANQTNYPLSNEGWRKTILVVKGRALDRVAIPWAVVVAHAAIITCVQEIVFDGQVLGDFVDTSWEVFLGFGLNMTIAFLLVFRLNRAADRFWTARTLWGAIVARGRTLVGGLAVHGGHRPDARDDAIRYVLAFTIASMQHLRGRRKKDINPNLFAGILRDNEIQQQLVSAAHPPLLAIARARNSLRSLFQLVGGENNEANDSAGRSPASAVSRAWVEQHMLLERQLNDMSDASGGCERIRGTPLPIVYVSHLRLLVLLTLLLLPYVYGPSWKWATIPLVALTAFSWLGIDAAAAEVEDPFCNRVNSLNTVGFCLNLLSTTLQEMQIAADGEKLCGVGSKCTTVL